MAQSRTSLPLSPHSQYPVVFRSQATERPILSLKSVESWLSLRELTRNLAAVFSAKACFEIVKVPASKSIETRQHVVSGRLNPARPSHSTKCFLNGTVGHCSHLLRVILERTHPFCAVLVTARAQVRRSWSYYRRLLFLGFLQSVSIQHN